jgi:(2R)-ethylmalonyl-CoA mutase
VRVNDWTTHWTYRDVVTVVEGAALKEAGVAAVFTPKDFGITEIIGRIVDEIRKANKLDPLEVPA